MTRPVASQRFRQRKLSTRSALQVLREKDLDAIDGEQQNTPKVETGVEKHEETEHHLQAALSASQAAAVGAKVAQIYIPTPETAQSTIPYAQLYQLKFSQPATYIRFSSTVEDCCGCPYNLTEEDDKYLRELNERLGKNGVALCSEDVFEEAMYFMEEATKTQQPFSTVGESPPVLSWEEIHDGFDENIDEPARAFARDIYEHWRALRVKNGNTPLQPGLRLKVIETSTDIDDNDPYVCFRRREVRQARKTRGRDAQSVEKLRRLRKELEEARQLVALVRQREVTKREQLSIDRLLFEQRQSLRSLKRSLPDPYKDGDEDLLVNQKPKKKPQEAVIQRTPLAPIRTPPRPDGKTSEAELVSLSDLLAEKENKISVEIKLKISQHQKWNQGFVDLTRSPLTPPPTGGLNNGFRSAITEYLPTPPASVSSEHSGDAVADEGPQRDEKLHESPIVVRYASPISEMSARTQPSFRRRTGRGGRIMIDRRGMKLQFKDDIEPWVLERFKFDHESDDEDDTPMYDVDPNDVFNMRYRAAIGGKFGPHHLHTAAPRRNQIDALAAAGNQHYATHPQLATNGPDSHRNPD